MRVSFGGKDHQRNTHNLQVGEPLKFPPITVYDLFLGDTTPAPPAKRPRLEDGIAPRGPRLVLRMPPMEIHSLSLPTKKTLKNGRERSPCYLGVRVGWGTSFSQPQKLNSEGVKVGHKRFLSTAHQEFYEAFKAMEKKIRQLRANAAPPTKHPPFLTSAFQTERTNGEDDPRIYITVRLTPKTVVRNAATGEEFMFGPSEYHRIPTEGTVCGEVCFKRMYTHENFFGFNPLVELLVVHPLPTLSLVPHATNLF